MKKTIIFIIFSIMLTIIPAVYAATDDSADALSKAKVLEHLEVLTFSPEQIADSKTVNRAEFCYMVSKLIKAEERTDRQNPFTDVTEATDYADSILCMYEIGCVNGAGGIFDPYEPIETSAALKITTGVLGYNDVAEYLGGYPAGYLKLGKKLDLTDGLELSPELSYKDCVMLLYNALDVEFAKTAVNIGGSKRTIYSGGTILKSYFGLEKHTGRMTANTITTLTGIKDSDDNTVTVGGTDYDVENGKFNYLLGTEIEYYASSDGKKLEFAIGRGHEKEIEISLDKINKNKSGIKSGIYYYDENDKEKNLNLNADADYIVNGTAFPDFTIDSIAETKGSIRAVDYDSNGSYDVIFYNYYYNFVVDDYSQETELLRGMYGKEIDFSLKSDIYGVTVLNSFGEEFDLINLNENDVLSVYRDEYGKYYTIYISNDVVAGNISSKRTNAGIPEITINDKAYKIPLDGDVDETKFNVGDNCILYLDYLGEIAYADFEKLTDMMYGYLIGLDLNEDSLADSLKVKVMTQNGNIMVFDTAKKLMLNGKYKDETSKDYTPEKIYNAAVFYKDSFFNPQLIRFKLNKKKEIDALETANAQTDSDTLQLCDTLSGIESRWMINQTGFYFRYTLQDDAVVFKVPKAVNGKIDDAKIDVLKVGELVGSRRYEGAQIYDCDKINAARCVVVPADYVDMSGNNCFVVENVGMSLDSERNTVYVVNGWYQGVKQKYLVSAEAVDIDDISLLATGDIIGPILNSKNEIIGFDIFLKAADATQYVNSETNRASYPYQTLGVVTARTGRVVRVSCNGLDKDDVYRIRDIANMYYVDLAEKEVKKATISDIEPQDITNPNVYVFFKFYNDQINDVVIISN